MILLARKSLLAALLFALNACSSGSGDGNPPGACSPPCGDGTLCQGGQCVSAPLDAGDQIIPGTRPDGGLLPGSVDAGLQACAADKSRGQQQPLDIYIMLDQSDSMSESTAGGQDKWDAVTSALEAFLQQPLDGVSVGLQYFALTVGAGQCTVVDCSADADCGAGCGPCDPDYGYCVGYDDQGTESCNAADYASPDVEIAPLPGVAQAIQDSIGRHSPTTLTPTGPALQGAIDHASAWAQANPGDVVIAILATDGEPTECDPEDIPSIQAIAAAGASASPPILTFVIGVGSSLDNLNAIASSGGTGQAFIVDTSQDVNQQFLDALNQIRGTALGCIYRIPTPASGTPDYGKVNVQYSPSGGGQQIIPQVADQALCPPDQDAWYYDDPANPTQIILCDYTCNQVKADSQGEIDVLLGCQTIIN